MTGIEIIFWGSLFLVGYTYVVYPFAIGFLSWLWGKSISVAEPISAESRNTIEDWPSVSLIVTAHNSEKVILERLVNVIKLDYPADRLEVIVGSRGDEDLTGDLVRTFNDSRVHFVHTNEFVESPDYLSECLDKAQGEIVVLTTADVILESDAIRKLIQHFRHEDVAAVCGELLRIDSATGQEIHRLRRWFDGFLKQCESRLGVFTGYESSVFAIRKDRLASLHDRPGDISNVNLTLSLYHAGHRTVFDGAAIARFFVTGLMSLETNSYREEGRSLLWSSMNPRYNRIAIVNWLRHLLRWLTPVFLIAAMVSNMFLASDPFYLKVLLIQETFYLVVIGCLLIFMARFRARIVRASSAVTKTANSVWPDFNRSSAELSELDSRPGLQNDQDSRMKKV